MNGAAIRAVRERLGWPQRRLAAALGVSRASLAAWEAGLARPRDPALPERLAAVVAAAEADAGAVRAALAKAGWDLALLEGCAAPASPERLVRIAVAAEGRWWRGVLGGRCLWPKLAATLPPAPPLARLAALLRLRPPVMEATMLLRYGIYHLEDGNFAGQAWFASYEEALRCFRHWRDRFARPGTSLYLVDRGGERFCAFEWPLEAAEGWEREEIA